MPSKPNNITISAFGVEDLNIGLNKLQGSYENSSMVWEGKQSRIWISSQAKADDQGYAFIDTDLVSPGIYHVKVFGDAAINATQVDLTMTMVKKIFIDGKFDLAIDTTGFPSGNCSISVKALNGPVSLDMLNIDGLMM